MCSLLASSSKKLDYQQLIKQLSKLGDREPPILHTSSINPNPLEADQTTRQKVRCSDQEHPIQSRHGTPRLTARKTTP